MAMDQRVDSATELPELAGLLRAWRRRALLTQEQLAQRTGLSVRTISRLEAGRLRPRSGSVRLLAGALGLGEAEQALLAHAARGRPVPPRSPAAAIPVPHQLPADVAGFTGRAEHLEQLDGLLGGDDTAAVVISAIAGTAGVGKTALAVHWAHRIADRFPDGQLHVNLGGYAPGPPVSAIQALRQLLYGLGLRADQIPVEVDAAAGLYRSLMAGRRMLVVLDNARDAGQVRPLLPGGPGCLVVVTSRDRLTGLVVSHGVHRLTLDVLLPHEGVDLLGRIVGPDRVVAEPAAVAELAGLCGHLPLALRIAAANLASHPNQSIARYAAELRGGDRLAGLEVDDDPQAGVRTAFDPSYAALDRPAQRLFRLLGNVPGRDFSVPAAAALAGIAPERAAQLLERLAAGHLLEMPAAGRYAFHDLLRHYARQRSEHDDDQGERQVAVWRWLDWYLQTADAAARLLYPHLVRLPVPVAQEGLPAAGFDEDAGALEWLDAEQANLAAVIAHAAEHRPHQVAWLVVETLRGYVGLRRHTIDWLAAAQEGLAAAAESGDARVQAAAHHGLGRAHEDLGAYSQAAEQYTTALGLARQGGWTDRQAAILGSLGSVYTQMGHLNDAAAYMAQALALLRQSERRDAHAAILANLANAERELGRLERAADHVTQALALHRQLGSRIGEAQDLANLGEVDQDLGRLHDADQHLTQALALFREIGGRFAEVYVLQALAAVHRDAGRSPQALELAQAAVTLAREIGDLRAEAQALSSLGSVELRLARQRDAVHHYRQALELARRIGSGYAQTGALVGLAAAHQHQGSNTTAIDYAEQAAVMAGQAGYRILEGQAHSMLAAAHLARDCHDQAAEHAQQALALHRATGHRLGQARTLVTLGHALTHAHDADAAAACWREALELFTGIGSPEAEATRALLHRQRDAEHRRSQ